VHVGVGVLFEQVEMPLQRIVHLDFDAGFGFEQPGAMLAYLVGESDAEIINMVEDAGEGLARGKGDIDSNLRAGVRRAAGTEEGLVSWVEKAGLKSGRVHLAGDVRKVSG